MTPEQASHRTGVLCAASAYFIWGLLPLYLKAVSEAAPVEVMLHRIIWSLVFLTALLAWKQNFHWLKAAFTQPGILLRFAGSAALISVNWFLYIWAVNSGRVVDASLGYFINPLVNVMLGALVLREHLRRAQWIAVGVAALGVGWLTWQAGQLPWIGLVLAMTFGTYGLLRKTATLGAMEGLTMETLLLAPFAGSYLAFLMLQDQSAFLAGSTTTRLLLLAAGPITAIPLILFAAGARRIPLSLLGLLQYIGPTLQMLLGVFLYHEPFSQARLAGFVLIWSALAIYTIEGRLVARRTSDA